MAIKAYVGIMGSGKTYEVASVVIYNAIKQGRRVISNIAGLNADEYYRLLELEGFNPDKLGQIVQIEHSQVLEPDFWLNDVDFKAGKQNFIQSGDLLVLDEIWRFWDGFSSTYKNDAGQKMPDNVMNFFYEHSIKKKKSRNNKKSYLESTVINDNDNYNILKHKEMFIDALTIYVEAFIFEPANYYFDNNILIYDS